MLQQTPVIQEAREAIREAMRGSPVYDDSFADIYNFVQWGVPEADLHSSAQVGLIVAVYLAQAKECVEVCHHQVSQTLAAIFDRIMTIEEIRERIDG